MKKSNAIVFVVISFFCSVIFTATRAAAQSSQGCEPRYEALKREFDALQQDRDNLLNQVRNLNEYKAKYESSEEEFRKFQAEKKRMSDELSARLEQVTMLQNKVDELESIRSQLVQETDTLKNSLEKMEIEYKIVPETRKKINQLQKENNEALRLQKVYKEKVGRLEEEKLDAHAQTEIYRRQLNDFKKRYERALAKNRSLEKKIDRMPDRFAELARENKVLIKQTALMHYNLGVFYTKNKEYSRAIAEFEKSIELSPEDAYAYYNLGYIYAEYVVNRPKAIECFRKFLRLSKAEDKDVDWVKKYILTWQTWEGKKPMD